MSLISVCPKCKSYDITIDLATNKIVCNVCKKNNWVDPKKIDIHEESVKLIEKDKQEIFKQTKQGIRIIDVKQLNIDFSDD